MEKYLNRVLSNFVSVFDTKARNEEKESSYHNLLVGILTGNADWLIKSNIEAGEGFADIVVETDDPDSGIIMELKYTKEFEGNYDEIFCYGISFFKKRCMVKGIGK